MKHSDYVRLGEIMLAAVGADECQKNYNSIDPYWIGWTALSYADINPDGTLN